MALSKFDDFLIHQVETTFDHVIDSDPRWYERYWFNVHAINHGIVVSHGLGVYPNVNLMDAFGSVVYQGTQRNVRNSRALNHERWDTLTGPLSVQVVKGLSKIRLALGENDQGISYDLAFEAVAPPVDRVPLEFMRVNGRVHQHAAMFAQCGRVSGWVRIVDRTFRAEPDTWWACKTNSWGIRSHVGGPEIDPGAPRRPDGLAEWIPSGVFLSAQFADRHVCILDQDGEITGRYGGPQERIKIVRAEHGLEFHPGTTKVRRVVSAITDEHGRELTINGEPWATAYVKGTYGAYKDYFDGQYRGEQAYRGDGYVETDRFDLANPEVIAQIAGRDDHVCRFSLGDEVGYGVFEVGVRGQEPYAPYDPSA